MNSTAFGVRMLELAHTNRMNPALCVVVGATGAVGRAVVERLDALGHPVLAVARNTQALADLATALPRIRPCVADIADDSAVAVIGEALTEPVRLAFFTAGLAVSGSVDTVQPGAFAEGVNVKVGGTVRLLHAVRDRFGEPATFITVAGSLGFEPGPMDAGPGTVNAALANLMRQISLLYGPRGVAVHTIAPGPLETPRLKAIAEHRAEETGRDPDQVLSEYTAKTSFGKLPSPDDVAWLVETLLAPRAWSLHGSVLTPDGGVRHTIL